MADIIHVSKFGAYKDVKTLRGELKKSPKSAELHFQLGEELLRAHTPANDKKGISHLETAIKLDPDCAEAYGLLAYKTIYENPRKGARLAKKAAELFRAKGDDEQADAILDEAAGYYGDKGWDNLRHGLTREALKEAERALKIYPDFIDALNIYGSVYLERFEYDKAEVVYQKAIAKAERKQGARERIKWSDLDSRPYMRARYGLGLVQIYHGEFTKALDSFKLMLKMNPDDHQGVRFLFGDLCLFMDDIKRAEKNYKEYGGMNGALIKLIKGDKTGAKRELEAIGNENKIMIELLYFYLSDYRMSAYIETPNDNPAEIFSHPKYKYLLWGLKRYYSYDEMNPLKYQEFRDAYDFCKLYGPLWVRHETRKLVSEVHNKL